MSSQTNPKCEPIQQSHAWKMNRTRRLRNCTIFLTISTENALTYFEFRTKWKNRYRLRVDDWADMIKLSSFLTPIPSLKPENFVVAKFTLLMFSDIQYQAVLLTRNPCVCICAVSLVQWLICSQVFGLFLDLSFWSMIHFLFYFFFIYSLFLFIFIFVGLHVVSNQYRSFTTRVQSLRYI